MSAIEIANLSKTFTGKRGKKIHALRELSLTIEAGEVFGFLGPNGAGKSTTIKTIMGMIRPTAGECRICGMPVSCPSARIGVGYLPENPAFYDFLTAREYLTFVGRIFKMDKSQINHASERVLELLDLREAADRTIKGYSKGMVQRMGLAQSLLHDPNVYVLDEPMSGLDPIGRALVKDIIKDLKKRGKTVFFSTHITADIEAVCDRVGIIIGGRLQTVNTVSRLLEKGIEGYQVRLRNCPENLLDGFEFTGKPEEGVEIYLARDSYKDFMKQFITTEAEIDMIEPKRKDLESFFLDTMAEAGK